MQNCVSLSQSNMLLQLQRQGQVLLTPQGSVGAWLVPTMPTSPALPGFCILCKGLTIRTLWGAGLAWLLSRACVTAACCIGQGVHDHQSMEALHLGGGRIRTLVRLHGASASAALNILTLPCTLRSRALSRPTCDGVRGTEKWIGYCTSYTATHYTVSPTE